MSSLQPLNLNTKHMRLTYAAITISILLLASIAFPIGTASAKKKIVAHGTIAIDFGDCTPPADTSGCISTRVIDGVTTIVTRDFFFVQTGEFSGHGNGIDITTVDGFILTSSAAGSFTGSVGGKEGTFALVSSSIVDVCLFPSIIVDGNFEIVEGSGVGDFEGVCGFGTFSLDDVVGTPLDITHVLAFDKDCKKFSVNDFLKILSDE